MAEDNILNDEQSIEETREPAGKIVVEEEVLAQLASSALASVEGVSPAKQGKVSNFLGRKIVDGVRIDDKNDDAREIVIEAFVAVKYGQRIPDVCWDVQSAIKSQVESYTGYTVKAVNVTVQGIDFSGSKTDAAESGENLSDNA